MRPFVRAFVQDCVEQLPLRGPVVEIGARPAETQERIAFLRDVVGITPYVGCDIQPGTNVDVVTDIHRLPFADESIGTVVCVEVLEHVHDPIRAVEEIRRVLAPGGIAVLTSVMFMPVHAHPWDFWRFTPEGFEKLLEPFESSLVVAHGYDLLPEGVYGVGVKGPDPDLGRHRLPRISYVADHWADGLPVDFGPIRLRTRDLWQHAMRESVAAAKRRLRRQP